MIRCFFEKWNTYRFKTSNDRNLIVYSLDRIHVQAFCWSGPVVYIVLNELHCQLTYQTKQERMAMLRRGSKLFVIYYVICYLLCYLLFVSFPTEFFHELVWLWSLFRCKLHNISGKLTFMFGIIILLETIPTIWISGLRVRKQHIPRIS